MIKKTCQICKRKFNRLTVVKGKALCYVCKRRTLTTIPTYGRAVFTLEKALSKSYNVFLTTTASGRPTGLISTPRVLIGRKVELILADDEK